MKNQAPLTLPTTTSSSQATSVMTDILNTKRDSENMIEEDEEQCRTHILESTKYNNAAQTHLRKTILQFHSFNLAERYEENGQIFNDEDDKRFYHQHQQQHHSAIVYREQNSLSEETAKPYNELAHSSQHE